MLAVGMMEIGRQIFRSCWSSTTGCPVWNCTSEASPTSNYREKMPTSMSMAAVEEVYKAHVTCARWRRCRTHNTLCTAISSAFIEDIRDAFWYAPGRLQSQSVS